MIAINTAIPKRERNKVAPVANEKAAPEFLMKLSWKSEPILFTGPRLDKYSTAQILVAKSASQISQATPKSVRHTRTVSAVLPSAYRSCTKWPVGILVNGPYQLHFRILRSFHNSWSRFDPRHALFAKPCHGH